MKIVNDLVGNFFFKSELDENVDAKEPTLNTNATKLFIVEVNENVGNYIVNIKDLLRFQLFIDHTKAHFLSRLIVMVDIQHCNCKSFI